MVAAATIPTPSEVFCDDTRFAETFLYILDKKKRRRKLRFNTAQQHYLANRTNRDLILKARQLGFSTAIQARLFRLVVTSSAATITLSHEQATTDKLRRMAQRYYDNLPLEFRPTRKYSNSRVATYPDFDSEAVIGTAGNVNIGRGGTYTDMHGSEFAFWPDAEAVLASVTQGGDPSIALESTPNGAQGHFYQLCMEALAGNGAWTLHFYPWWWDSTYKQPLAEGEILSLADDELQLMQQHNLTLEQIKWRRSKQKELKYLFVQEYPEDPQSCFLRSGFGYFGDLTGVFTAPLYPEPDSTHRYVAGLDFGQTNDFTALSILDAMEKVQVALLRINGLSWREMRRRVAALCKEWNVARLLAERNSMGETNIEELRQEFKDNDCKTHLASFWTDNDSKASIMGSLHETLSRKDGLKLQPIAEQRRELNAFKATQLPSGVWRLSAPDNEHDDTVIALALANRALTGGGIRVENV